MKAHRNVEKLLKFLGKNKPASVAHVVASGLLNIRDTQDAFQYGVNAGVFDRIKVEGAGRGERTQYTWNGKQLPADLGAPALTFEPLLEAWGIAIIPPMLQHESSRRYEDVC